MITQDQQVMPAGLRSTKTYLPALETLRGVAIVLVVLFHYHGILGIERSADATLVMRVIAAGNTGVTLFFVLSGFLLVRPFLSALYDGSPVSIMRFYRARALRILPAYLVMVGIAWCVTANPLLWKALVFVPLGYEAFPFALPWWTLCTEVQFYLLLPWLMLIPRMRLGGWLLAGLLLTWFGLYTWFAIGLDWPPAIRPLRSSVFGRGSGFFAGALLAWFVHSPAHERLQRQRLAWPLLTICSLSLLGLLGWYGGQPKRVALAAFPMFHDAEAVLWAGIMLSCLTVREQMHPRCFPAAAPTENPDDFRGHQPPHRAAADFLHSLVSGPVAWAVAFLRHTLDRTAVISYSLYLVHVPIQFYVMYPALGGKPTGTWSWRLLSLVIASGLLSWIAAWFGYRFVELPFLRRKASLPT